MDRSGWGGAVARCLAGEPLSRAMELLSPTMGHVCLPLTCPLHRFFALYEEWLERGQRPHTGASFRSWAMQEYCPPPYDAHLAWEADPLPGSLMAGELLELPIRVTNRSPETWRLSAETDRGIRLGIRALGPFHELPAHPLAILRTPGNPARDLARAGMEEGQIHPGESHVFVARFNAPVEPGRYVLHIDMVDELVHWFSDLGGPGMLIRVQVTPG